MSNAASARSPEWYRVTYRDKSISGNVAAATNGISGAIAAVVGLTIWIQKITVHITTDAAQSLTIRDTAGTPINVMEIPASPGDGSTHTIDFGARGYALTADKGLDFTQSAAGLGYSYAIDAYARQTIGSAISMATAAAL